MINTENFEFERIYHIFSHVNGKEVIFREDSNYYYFLEKLSKYIIPIADIYAYCMMPNHFHLLLRFKSFEEIRAENEHQYLMKTFSNLLNSYAKAFNKVYHRKGALFLNTIKRKKVNDDKYLLKALHYIHNNPVNHGFVNKITDWKYSSYNSYLSNDKESKLHRETILEYFETLDDFIAYHYSNVEYDYLNLE
ncbi:transposase [Elizabethkingia meningoseptica]|uniref:transposase n=1 Tax=Elizabethkingia meningoseptica TaxID=238 RepID=UPI000841B02C|nr:transposase [Elizabethkingia meningoseptica]EJK5330617.1 transposase [Elizabethkingia meningoseptica]MDE5432477.1 transposase [Elizabethkingia meningoseptica]MDE5439483.1 transposase [Elizabethkingia meningoseptica]MDE5450574.1 transposase [Elizabethkingia meningoseptica]MDE5469499.1 transposase [Elizabethkingia meningoseptica]